MEWRRAENYVTHFWVTTVKGFRTHYENVKTETDRATIEYENDNIKFCVSFSSHYGFFLSI